MCLYIFTIDLFDDIQVDKEENARHKRHKLMNNSIKIETERVVTAIVTSNKTLTNQNKNI